MLKADHSTSFVSARSVCLVATLLAGCTPPPVQGSGVLLNMQPAPPAFSSSYDFDLLDAVTGRGCVSRESPRVVYWVQLPGLEQPRDEATRYAIGAAAYAALSSAPEADTILVMRVEAKEESGEVCATLRGRGIRIRKTGADDTRAQETMQRSAEIEIPSLDRSLITQTIKDAMPQVLQCGAFQRGDVKISFSVAANGIVNAANVIESPADELGSCVANEAKRLVFPPSRSGATFIYTFKL